MCRAVAGASTGSTHRESLMFRPTQPHNQSNVRSSKPATAMTRRTAVAAALAMPLSAHASGATLAELIQRTEMQASAFMRGDMDQWWRLVRIADDFTLMQPFGGAASHGFNGSP